MKISSDIYEHLSSRAFDNELIFHIERKKYKPVRREEFIIPRIQDKKVIHVGCADHIEVVDEKIRKGIWLHNIITEKSEKVIGVDINDTAIDYLQKEHNISNVISGDISKEVFPEIRSESWDYVLFGEILEHLDNPVMFLSGFKDTYRGYVDKFIVSVPSIMTRVRYRYMMEHKEIINSDHRFWFTPYTSLKILARSGYTPEEIHFVNPSGLTIPELVTRKIKKNLGIPSLYPFMYFNTIMVTGKI